MHCLCLFFLFVLVGFFFPRRHFSKQRATVRIFNLGQMCLLIMGISYLITVFRRLLSWIEMAGLMSGEFFSDFSPYSWIWCWVSLLRDDMHQCILVNIAFRTWNCCGTISHVVPLIFWMLQSLFFPWPIFWNLDLK